MEALEVSGTFNQFLPCVLLEPSRYHFTAHSELELPRARIRRSPTSVTEPLQCQGVIV